MRSILAFCSLFFILGSTLSCNDTEIGSSKDVNPEAVYFDYSVWSEEGRENAVVKLQYRMGGPDGTTLVLEEPSGVTLDGESIPVDSTRFNGAYYELLKPLTEFGGSHQIVFTDFNGKTYTENFDFQTFTISPPLPESLSRSGFTIQFTGLDPLDSLNVWLTDTLFDSEDINENMVIRDNKLEIGPGILQRIVSGPINLQLYRERELPLKNAGAEGGTMTIRYGLRRVFELVD